MWPGRTEAEEKHKREGGMQTAAESTNPAPMCRYSQKGVKKLLAAVAADGEGLQHGAVTVCVLSEDRHCAGPHAHTVCAGVYLKWRNVQERRYLYSLKCHVGFLETVDIKLH